MLNPRPRWVAAAVTTVLAVTAGTAVTAPAVAAAPQTAAAVTAAAVPDADAPIAIDPGAEVRQLGGSGYLTATKHVPEGEDVSSSEMRWHRYSDGTSVLLAAAWSRDGVLATAAPSDIVPTYRNHDSQLIRLRDMAAPADTAPVVIDLAALPGTVVHETTVGSTVIARRYDTGGTQTPLLVSRTDGTQTARTLTGLPTGLTAFRVETAERNGVALVSYTSDAGSGLALVDTRTAAVTESYTRPTGQNAYDKPSFSATRVSWWEHTATTSALVVADRATKETQRFDFPDQPRRNTLSAPLGDWVLYGTYNEPGTGSATDPLLPLTGRSLKDGTRIKLLDRVTSAPVTGADGALYVQGGSVEQGEGLYRLTLGPDGVPSARPAYGDGTSTTLNLTKTGFGPSVVIDPLEDGPQFTWTFSHPHFGYAVTLTNRASGQKKVFRGTWGLETLKIIWYGNLDSAEDGAWTPGAYTWELDASPSDGIGPNVHATGDFTLSYVHRPHDYSSNGTPDLFARDSAGRLWRADSQIWHNGSGYEPVSEGSPVAVGTGWHIYDQIESVADVAGTVAPDTIARDTAGVLWLHQGTGNASKPFLSRVKVGGGWQIYHQLAGGSDLTGDGRADLVAADKVGDLYLYKGTGGATAPFAPRKKIGYGWGIYNQLTAVGDIAGGPAGDLLARDKDGVLWLYLGKGDGTFASRVKVGAGWNAYQDIVGIGDGNKDGRPDLYVYGPNKTAYFYAGTGDWGRPLQARRASTLLLNAGTTTYNHVS
ncbi:VCBS repeat-containing protein [Streptomyces sp. NPDC002825]|uniref:FG-GAP repeat domain-containing protein n=1 Tax=Streptomyces sp. NPDC002825 TaxID=3154666 RepID=UPI00331E1703